MEIKQFTPPENGVIFITIAQFYRVWIKGGEKVNCDTPVTITKLYLGSKLSTLLVKISKQNPAINYHHHIKLA